MPVGMLGRDAPIAQLLEESEEPAGLPLEAPPMPTGAPNEPLNAPATPVVEPPPVPTAPPDVPTQLPPARRVDEIEAGTAELEDWETVRGRLEADRPRCECPRRFRMGRANRRTRVELT